ncbi:uncharacterized protein K452DRAFT_59364 [Aplosporella prunicola CBS 121167]|uniref:Uncharacterized protein n=1 Tax=Aplosporella prunicola CBS 121167 TaxID=1176127 RepID=A0A6A6B786_9PEZI|nr:uncharacterized protein K452DRAFT_59364 [Aplosporella prunicola CBS 121167]KAF2140012.1 hypothetical protein K452DRAFT_59364 [Aplosporella prunicola CBS 121167]
MEPVYLSELDEYVQQLVSNCPDIEKSMDSMPEPVGVSQLPASDLPTVHPSLPQAQSSVNFMFQNTIVPWNAKPTGLENVVSLLSKLSITSKAIYSTLDADEDAGLAMEANQCSHPLALSDLEEMRGHIGQIATSLQDLEKLWWGLEKKGSCTRQFRERISFLTGQAIEKNWPETKENAAARSQDSAQFGGIPNLNHEVSAVSLGNPSGFPMVDPKTTIRLVPQSAEDFDPFVGSGPFDIEGSLTIPQSASGRDPFVRSSSFDTGGSLDPFVSSGPFDTNGSLVYLPGPRSTQGLTGMPAFRGSEYGGSNFMATSFGRSSTNLLSDFLHSENVRTEAPAEVPGSEHTSVAQTDRTEKFAHENGALAPKRQPRSKKVADKDLSPPLRRSGRSKGKSTSATTPANNRKKGPGRGKRPNSKMPSKQTQSVTTAVNDSAPETEQQPFASSQDMADSGLRRSTRIRNLLAPSSTTPMQTVATETRNSSLMGSGNSTTTTSGTVRKRAATRPPSTPGSANKRGRTRRTSSMNNFEEASGVSDTYDAGGYSSFGRTSAFNNNQGTGDADTFGRPNVGNSVGSYNGSNSFDSLGGSMTTSSANGFNRDLVSPFGPPRPSSPRGTLEAYARIQAARQAISTVHDAEGNTQPWNKVLSAEEMRTLKGPLSWSPQKENDTAPPGT